MKKYLILFFSLGIISFVNAGYVKMDKAPTNDFSPQNSYAYEKTVNLAAIGNSDWVLIPAGINAVSVTLEVAGGAKAKVQATTDSVYIVKTATPVGVDWNYGEVSINKQDTANPVTAIRLVQTFAGATKLTLRAQ